MKFTTAVVSLALAVGALAAPVAPVEVEERDVELRATSASQFKPTPVIGCLLPFQATNIVNAFQYLLANPKAANFASTANSLFSNDFTDTSDSINQLAGNPIGSVTFNGKAAFIAGSGSQPPLVTKTLDFFWSCKAIAWRWQTVSGAGDDAESIKGIDTFYINTLGQIEAVDAEFNSLGFASNLGNPECSASKRDIGRTIAI